MGQSGLSNCGSGEQTKPHRGAGRLLIGPRYVKGERWQGQGRGKCETSDPNKTHGQDTRHTQSSSGTGSAQRTHPCYQQMSDSTELHLPQNLPYPIKILPNLAPSSASVQRGTRLLDYSWTFTPQNAQKEVRYGSWDSSVEGTIEKWNFKSGETISQRRARDSPALYIIEPCKHGVQLGGLCCLCGKDMTKLVPRPQIRNPSREHT